MKVGDLVRCTGKASPRSYIGQLAVVTQLRGDDWVFPFEIKLFSDGEYLPVNIYEIEEAPDA